ncbi:MAG: glycosyltransferase [Nitrospira sp.]|nr:glycosyltransferase [Nitrospira sp.]
MRIAHISPFLEQVSSESQDPQGRMIFHLTKQLTRLGHEVTVFASGDSRTAGELIPVAPLSMRSYPAPKRHLAEALAMLALEKAFATLPSFDIIHLHSGLSCLPLMRRSPIPIVSTVYDALDAPEVIKVYREFKELALIATCAEQLKQVPDLNWQAVIPCLDMLRWKNEPQAVERSRARTRRSTNGVRSGWVSPNASRLTCVLSRARRPTPPTSALSQLPHTDDDEPMSG